MPMNNNQSFSNQIQQCIQHCNQTANQLRSLANQTQDPTLRDMLTEGAHHVEMCVKKCDFSNQWIQHSQQTQGQRQQMSYQY